MFGIGDQVKIDYSHKKATWFNTIVFAITETRPYTGSTTEQLVTIKSMDGSQLLGLYSNQIVLYKSLADVRYEKIKNIIDAD